MPSTLKVNKLAAVHKGSGHKGVCFADALFVTKNPVPVIVPMPNFAMASKIVDGPKSVKSDGKMLLVEGAKISKSTGGEAGKDKGLISMGQNELAEPITYSFNVLAEGKGICRQTDSCKSNKGNGVGTIL